MNSRRQFLGLGSLGILSSLFPLKAFSADESAFEGMVVNDQEGETVMIRNGTTTLRIKISKGNGSQSMSFLSESILPGEGIPVHKHLNEDELIFIHKGSGFYTLGEKKYTVMKGQWLLYQREFGMVFKIRVGKTLKCVLPLLRQVLKVFSGKLELLPGNHL